MKALAATILTLTSLASSAEVIHRQKVGWVLQSVPGHRVSCKDYRPDGYYNGGRGVFIAGGIPRGLPAMDLVSGEQFKTCADLRPLEPRWTLAGVLTVEVDDVCEIGGRFRRTLREFNLTVRENGLRFLGREVVSKVRLPNNGVCFALE